MEVPVLRSLLGSLATAGVVLSLLGWSACAAAEAADGQGVTVELRAAAGSGCPAGTAAVTTADGGDGFTVSYPAFEAHGGDFKNCQVVVKVTVPPGLTYAVDEVDSQGSARLGIGVTAMVQMTSYFTGTPETVADTEKIDGPYSDGWQTTHVAATPLWAPCTTDHFLNINDVVSLNGPSTNTVKVSTTSLVRLRWRSC